MEIGLYANTHGLGKKVGEAFVLQHTPFDEISAIEIAQLAERFKEEGGSPSNKRYGYVRTA